MYEIGLAYLEASDTLCSGNHPLPNYIPLLCIWGCFRPYCKIFLKRLRLKLGWPFMKAVPVLWGESIECRGTMGNKKVSQDLTYDREV